MPEEESPGSQPTQQTATPQRHRHRKRRRRRRSISEAHAKDKRIRHKTRGTSRLWWFAPILIAIASLVFLWKTGGFEADSDPMTEKKLADVSKDNLRKARAKLRHGRAMREAGVPDQGLPHLEEALQLVPLLPDLAAELAYTHFELGDLEEAVRYAQLSLDRSESVARCNYLIGVSFCLQERYRDALPHFKKANDNFEDSLGLWRNWGDALRATGKTNMAIDKLERALAKDPSSKLLLLKLSLARVEGDNEDVVEREVDRDIRWAPELHEPYITKIAILLKRGKKEEASRQLESFEEAFGPTRLGNFLQDVHFIPYRRDPDIGDRINKLIQHAREVEKTTKQENTPEDLPTPKEIAPPKKENPFQDKTPLKEKNSSEEGDDAPPAPKMSAPKGWPWDS